METPDIFISYKSDQKPRIDLLASVLTDLGLVVWHDASLIAGEAWNQKLVDMAMTAKCVVGCWSKGANRSKWIKMEMDAGLKREKLIPVMFGPAGRPLRYGRLQFVSMQTWQGELDHPGLGKLVEGVGKHIAKPISSFLNHRIGGQSPAAVSALRLHLVDMARKQSEPISYEAALEIIASALPPRAEQPMISLFGTLDAIAAQNRSRREPPLFGLVVNAESKIPGRGYFQKQAFLPGQHNDLARALHKEHLNWVYKYRWPNDA